MGLLVTLLLGFSIIFGALISLVFKNSEKFVTFSLALATGVISMLIFLHLGPDALEVIPYNGFLKYLIFFVLIFLGFIILFVLDKFVPDHEDDDGEEDDDKNLKHIGIVSSIALFIHNIVEGMAVYLIAQNDLKAAFVTSVAIGLHNIPLGIVIASTIYKDNKNIKKTILYVFTISLSTFLGGLILFITNNSLDTSIIELISVNITIGMLLFILVMELLPKIYSSKYKKITFLGVIIGIMLLILSFLFE